MKSFMGGLLVLTVALVFTVPGNAFKEGGQNCAVCHKLSESEAKGILAKIDMPEAKVLSIGMGPVKGLWEVDLENKGHRLVLYVDFAKKLITPGPFFDYAARKDVTKEKTEALNKDRKIDVSGLSLKDALVIGRVDAPTRIIVFTDPGCPYCAKLHDQMKVVVAKRPDISFYLKLFTLISRTPTVAKSVVCSKSLTMLDDA
ncbi:MAG: thioredoxin domain-containing protein, partial [Syntrophorhabdales bacterium]